MNQKPQSFSENDIEIQLTELGNSLRKSHSIRESVISRLDQPSNPLKSNDIMLYPRRFVSRLRDLTLFQKVSLSALSVAATLFVVVFSLPHRPIGFAQVIERAKNATSLRAQFKLLNPKKSDVERPPVQSGRIFWKAVESIRVETDAHLRSPEKFDGPIEIAIQSDGKPSISIDMTRNTYRYRPIATFFLEFLVRLEELESLLSIDHKELGSKTIDGRECVGFEFLTSTIDPKFRLSSYKNEAKSTIWVDRENQLPWQVELGHGWVNYVAEKIVWNVPLDSNLFDPIPPEGFFLGQEENPTIEQQMEEIRIALRMYADRHDGKYPPFRGIYTDIVFDELVERSGIDRRNPDWRNEKVQEVYNTRRAWEYLDRIRYIDRESKYNGLMVGPEDKDEILLEWKLKDGSLQRIYGDLHLENVKQP